MSNRETLLEGKRRLTIEIGGKTAQQLEGELEQAGVRVSEDAKDLMAGYWFTTIEDRTALEVVIAKIADLGFKRRPMLRSVYSRAHSLGLWPCPAEVGPHLRLALTGQPTNEGLVIGMMPIRGRHSRAPGVPLSVFWLGSSERGLWLDTGWAYPGTRWDPEIEIVWCLSKPQQAPAPPLVASILY